MPDNHQLTVAFSTDDGTSASVLFRLIPIVPACSVRWMLDGNARRVTSNAPGRQANKWILTSR